MDAATVMSLPTWLKGLIRRQRAHEQFPADAPLASLRYVIVDTELTSLDRRSNRILSIGAIVMDGKKIRLGENFYKIVNPGVGVPAETVVVHGLRPLDVVEGAAPAAAVNDFLAFAGDAIIVGHFVEIDLSALKKEEPGEQSPLDRPAIDTCRVQRWLDERRNAYQGDRGHHVDKVDLISLARRYGIEVPEAHHALQDALLTAQLWQRLIAELEKSGITMLKQLMRIARASCQG